MNWKKLLCAGLCGALLAGAMAGCGAAEPQPTPAADDIAYQATGLSRDTVLFTVDGREVTADQYLYWLLTSISTAKSAGYLADDEAWEEEIEGQPTADYLKEQALEISKLYAAVANHADEAGIVVTEDQRAEAEEQLDQMGAMYEAYYGLTTQEWLDQQCISREGYLGLNDAYYLVTGLEESLKESGELDPTDDDIRNMIDSEGIYSCKHILLAFPQHDDGSDPTDEEKAATKAEADALYAEITAAADPAAAFDTAMNEQSDDGRDETTGELYKPEGYTFLSTGAMVDGSGSLVTEFVTAGTDLEVGQISQPVETDYGYHILLRQDADNEETRTAYTDYAMNQLLDQWTADAKVETTEAYDNLDPKAFYDFMMNMVLEWQEEQQAEAEAAASASPSAETESPAPETESPAAEPSASPAA
ncbi:peptidylprolyl isomerase [Flavonifractor sp. An112]|uniref:peptidylprolyl isomerase n=1 Tax=Flavonifractor sp. An112 TaxID=1965544 RepID=UPI00174CDC72|nr:peptidylprolyl isomerase [Flavonifractor sp. An112]HIZ93560.1 peptidylprolyl isomerase [Candidatus Flavonifractor avicola]